MMPQLNIRGLDDDTHAKLRMRAARHRRSMEEEARQILRAAVNQVEAQDPKVWSRLAERAKRRAGGRRSKLDSADLIREDRDA